MSSKIVKTITTLVIIFLLVSGRKTIYSVSPSSETTPSSTGKLTPGEKVSPSPTSAEIIDKLKKIEILKEKIATKVAEIREKEKGAIGGTIKKVSTSTITIATAKGDQTISFLDDVTYYSLKEGTKKETSAKMIKEQEFITVFGYYDQEKTTLAAKYIYFESPSLHIYGKIVDIDKTNYTITLKEKQGETVVDVEKYTQTSLFDRKKKNFATSGFSKMKIGNIAHILALPNPETENRRVSAKKIYILFSPIQPTIEAEKVSSPSATPQL